MSTKRKYKSPQDMRTALEERLNRMSKEQGVENQFLHNYGKYHLIN